MIIKRIFIGNVMLCNYYKNGRSLAYKFSIDEVTGKTKIVPDELIEKEVVLIKVSNDRFVDISRIETNFDLLKAVLFNKVLFSEPRGYGVKYVDKKSLKPYANEKNKVFSIKRLKI